MRVGELLKHLGAMPRDAEVIIVGVYSSEGNIEDVDYRVNDFRGKAVVVLESDICSG